MTVAPGVRFADAILDFLASDHGLLAVWILGVIAWCVFCDAVSPGILDYVKRLRGNRRI